MSDFTSGLLDVATAGYAAIPGAQNGFGLGSSPSFQQQPMDPGSQTQIAVSQNQLGYSPEQNQANILEGTGEATNIANQASNQNAEQHSQGGGGINGMSAAIGQKAQKNFAIDQGRLGQASQIEGMQMANKNAAMAAQTSMSLAKAQEGITSQSNALDIAANAARYNTISQLMGGAGSMAGGYWGKQSSSSGGGGGGSNDWSWGDTSDMGGESVGTNTEMISGEGGAAADTYGIGDLAVV